MEIQHDKLIREIPIRIDDNIVSIERRCVITKDEFIACYNTWVKECPNCGACMIKEAENE